MPGYARAVSNESRSLLPILTSWHEATSALRDNSPSSSIVIALDEGLTEDVPVQADHVSLDFLETPSHPEMLGRLAGQRHVCWVKSSEAALLR